jgi:hypothetical protein
MSKWHWFHVVRWKDCRRRSTRTMKTNPWISIGPEPVEAPRRKQEGKDAWLQRCGKGKCYARITDAPSHTFSQRSTFAQSICRVLGI